MKLLLSPSIFEVVRQYLYGLCMTLSTPMKLDIQATQNDGDISRFTSTNSSLTQAPTFRSKPQIDYSQLTRTFGWLKLIDKVCLDKKPDSREEVSIFAFHLASTSCII
jgi:hypothetical protein